MTLQQFKDEFRLICTDSWGDACEAWFECAGRLHRRSQTLPPEWFYSAPPASPFDGTNPESYWYAKFGRCGNRQLQTIGAFLFRYCETLRRAGKSY